MSSVRGEVEAMRKTVRGAAHTLSQQTRSIMSQLTERAQAALGRGIARLRKAGERTGWRRV